MSSRAKSNLTRSSFSRFRRRSRLPPPNLFERQLAIYSSHHRDHRNRATHFIGIPAIALSVLLALALWRVELGDLPVSGAWLIGIAAAVGWIALDRTIGVAMAVAILPMIVFADWFAGSYAASSTWWLFAILFVGGWALQLVGHAFEGRRPALVDNLFQAFIGPMFLMAEILISLGLRRDLARHLASDAKAA
jgi:uncharacterized membrane protein YGL010W